MNLLCRLIGHRPLTTAGWMHGVGYAAVSHSTVDGLGTKHLYLLAECPRCGEKYSICNVHVPNERRRPTPTDAGQREGGE